MKTVLILCAVAAAAFLLLLFLILPGRRRDTARFCGLEIAHRGLHGDGIPENSLAAFAAAKRQGLPVEFDVQFTRDRRLVVFHDKTLERVCGVPGNVRDYSYGELRGFPLGGTRERIPLLSEVLRLLGDTPFVCEIKYYDGLGNCDICRQLSQQLDTHSGPYCVESFSPLLLRWFRRHRPAVLRGQLATGFSDSKEGQPAPVRFVMRNLLMNFLSRPDFIAYQFTDSSWGYRLCTRLAHPLTVGWTARGKQQLVQAKSRFDSVIFERRDDD